MKPPLDINKIIAKNQYGIIDIEMSILSLTEALREYKFDNEIPAEVIEEEIKYALMLSGQVMCGDLAKIVASKIKYSIESDPYSFAEEWSRLNNYSRQACLTKIINLVKSYLIGIARKRYDSGLIFTDEKALKFNAALGDKGEIVISQNDFGYYGSIEEL